MAGPWEANLNRKFSTGGMSPAPGNPSMGAGGVPYASGLMGKPGVPPVNPGGSGSQTMPGIPIGNPGSPQGSPQGPSSPMGAGPQGSGGSPMEMQQAVLMVQQLMQRFRSAAEKLRGQDPNASSV